MPQSAPDLLYFAYGSNMSSRRLIAPGRAPSATRATVGYVPGRRLTFDKFSSLRYLTPHEFAQQGQQRRIDEGGNFQL